MGLRFVEPTVSRVRQFIRDPKYAGAYIYGIQHWRRVQRGGVPVPDHRLIGQFVENWHHHEGYIVREEYVDNLNTLEVNAKTPKQSQLGPGPAVLQGRCRCAVHGAMSVVYHQRVHHLSWSFRCQGDVLRGGETCVNVPGIALEEIITVELLKALDVPIIEEAERLWRATHREWSQRHRGLQGELNRKMEQRDRVKQLLTGPCENLRLRAMYEEEFLKVDVEVELLQRRARTEDAESDPFTEERWGELKRLCADLPSIWSATSTTAQDRKQLFRMLVSYVQIESVDKERIVATIQWRDERPTTTVELFRVAYYHRLMWQWHLEGMSLDGIVDRFAAMGAKTQQSNAWSRGTVEKTLALMVRNARRASDLPPRDVPLIRWKAHAAIADMTAAGHTPDAIATHLNATTLLTRFGNAWSGRSVARVIAQMRRKPHERY